MSRTRRLATACLPILLTVAALGGPALAAPPAPRPLTGLHRPAAIIRDGADVAHVRAADERDAFFLLGWVHAQDRLFQMDTLRRRASGTLAELLGPGALAGDVQLRTLGLRRAAERSLPLLSARTRSILEAYAAGVNASAAARPLPPEYAALELTRVEPWTPLDSAVIAKLIAFGLAFDLSDLDRTVALQRYVAALGPAAGQALFAEDLFRAAPFDPASTVPDARQARPPRPGVPGPGLQGGGPLGRPLHPRAAALAAEWLGEARAHPLLRRVVDRDLRDGSNQWAVAGRFTRSGAPLLANDPHLPLGTPSTFYPVHLQVGPAWDPGADLDVIGNSFPGAPAVATGHNRHVAWGATYHAFDVTDVYQEQLRPDPASPGGLSTVYQGRLEPVVAIPEAYRVNAVGDGVLDDVVPAPPDPTIPAATLIVPRRNDGPLVKVDLAAGVGLSVAYTGFAGTRELETFLALDRARDLAGFQAAVSGFDLGSQHFCYADDGGTVAYLTYSAVPVREDLESGAPAGAPPWLVRDGTGGNEWLPAAHPTPGGLPFETIPFEEMPRIVNPPAGFVINANNDPDGLTLGNDLLARRRPGGGILYLSAGYDAGFRAGRITRRVKEVLARRRMGFEDMQSIQADVKLLDAAAFVPHLRAAFRNARRPGAPAPLAALASDPAVAEAVGRLLAWDGSTPTGLAEGYDAADVDGRPAPPSRAEIEASVAATLYAVWRGRLVVNVIDAHLGGLPTPPDEQVLTALRHLLDGFPAHHGVGASGLDFFAVPELDATPQDGVPAGPRAGRQAGQEDRRDLLLLRSVADALALLSGPAFAPAFHGSARQDDYRWGKLHRIVFAHPLGGAFDVPPALGAFPAPLPGLAGLPTDGGFQTVDAATHPVRAASAEAFRFDHGPSNRLVVELSRGPRERAESVWPGGVSAVPGTPGYLNLLPLWLTNDTVPLLFTEGELLRGATAVEVYTP